MANNKRSSLRQRLSQISSLQLALGFAAFGVLATAFITPSAERLAYQTSMALFVAKEDRIDPTTTASVTKPDPAPRKNNVRYRERRTIFHKPGDPPCLIYEDGSRGGKCFDP